ncbi:MAG: 50S ribosomal protein L22 [Alphaproteobacteria bacterium]|nr:50S ribosomal protein L22 [Alphaproteobacteria bacterium]
MSRKSTPRRLAENEAVAKVMNLRVSPRKLGLVAGLIRGKSCEQALADLEFSHRRIARDVKKVLQSAIANAENNHQLDVDKLYVADVSVGRGLVMRRWHARGRGRAAGIEKFFSHLRLIVRERDNTEDDAKAAKGKAKSGKSPAKKSAGGEKRA